MSITPKLHHQAAQRLFYEQLKRFVFFIFLVPVTPILIVKGFFFIYPQANVHEVLNTLIFIYFCLVTLATCVYAMLQYASIQKGLKPVSELASFGDLAAKVAHDVRSPLSGIRTVSKSLQRISSSDPELSKYIDLLDMSSRRLEGIAEDLLNSHQSRDNQKILLDLHQLLDDIIFEFSSQLNYTQVCFKKQYHTSSLILLGYEHQLFRVFQNLFKNAAEAMNFKGEIVVKTHRREQDAVISVLDAGPGLSDAQIQKVLHGPYTEGKSDGHGLGLTYVREVLERHDGQFHIQSVSGKGACFEIRLPLQASKRDKKGRGFEVLTSDSLRP